MAKRFTINMITPDTDDWICKVQVIDKSRPKDNKEKTKKYQIVILQDEEENQVQGIIYNADITFFENKDMLLPFKTYLISVAYVKEPPLGYENSLNKFTWTIDHKTIIEPVEKLISPEDPLPPPTRLTLATFDTLEYQSKEHEFDVLAIVINGGHPIRTTNGKKIQEFILMDKLKKPTKLTLWEDYVDNDEDKLFAQLHAYPIIVARRIGKASSGTSNKFNGLTNRFNTTIAINPPYPQVAALRTWIKTIEPKLIDYKMKSTTTMGSILLIPFEVEVISIANIQMQPPGQAFYIEAELSLVNNDQRFCVLVCSNCKQLFTRCNVRREIYCIHCDQSTHLIPRCQFEVVIKDNSGETIATISDEIAEKMLQLTSEEIYEISVVKKETLSLQNVQNHLSGRIFNIQMKRLFTKNVDTSLKLIILSYMEKQVVIQKSPPSPIIDISDLKKRSIEHLDSEGKQYPSMTNKISSSSHKQGMEMKTPPSKKN